MQTEKSQPLGQQIMPETQWTLFPALSVYPRVGISLSASETDGRFYLSCNRKQSELSLPTTDECCFSSFHMVLRTLLTLYKSCTLTFLADSGLEIYTRPLVFTSSLSVRTSENCYWLALSDEWVFHSENYLIMPFRERVFQNYQNTTNILCWIWSKTHEFGMFPASCFQNQKAIVNKILRLHRAIVDPLQIRFNAVSC